MMMMMMMIGD